MYLREVVSPRKRGPDTRYLQLVEGERDAQGRVQTRILHSFGRTDHLDLDQIRRLVEPVQHRTPGRITAHVHICVLAYLLMRVAENRAQLGWQRIREQVERISLTELTTDRASVLQTKALARAERNLLNCCKVAPPPKILQIKAP